MEWVYYPPNLEGKSCKGRRVVAGAKRIPKDTSIACMKFRARMGSENETDEKFAVQFAVNSRRDRSFVREWGLKNKCLQGEGKRQFVTLIGLRDGGLSEVACRMNTLMRRSKTDAPPFNCKMSEVFINDEDVPSAWIKSIKDIDAGEELFWDYGYSKKQLEVQYSQIIFFLMNETLLVSNR